MPEQTDRALSELCTAVERARTQLGDVLDRAAALQEGRSRGLAYAELVPEEARPLVVEMLTQVLDELAVAGAAFRRSEARALHGDGLSQEAIATLFGVTRQRVSVLLQSAARAQET